MTKLYADLHMHTTCSDGKLTVEELVEKATAKGFSAISITDHDTVESHRILRSSGYNGPVKIFPGIEVSCFEHGRDIHLLGYFVDIDNEQLKARELEFRKDRERRARGIVAKFNTLNIRISYEEVEEAANGAPIGRPHIASVLVERGFADSIQKVFDLYLDSSGPAYVAKSDFSVKEGVELIQSAGGVSSVAHPGRTYTEPRMFLTLIASGIDAIEVYHPSHWHNTREYYRVLCEQHGLLSSGGSDYHGTRDFDEQNFGTFGVVEENFVTLHALATKRRLRNA